MGVRRARRPDLSLPGEQRSLIEAVLDANPRTVVVVNAGSPVEMPWADRAGAILLPWYGGEEAADALADIITGSAEPTGRLPITFPVRAEDGPTAADPNRYPGQEAKVVYSEGVLVGYRHYDTAGVTPLFPLAASPTATSSSRTSPSHPMASRSGSTTPAPEPAPKWSRSTYALSSLESAGPIGSLPPSPR